MKITDKIVTSVTPPQQTNVLWHNPETGELIDPETGEVVMPPEQGLDPVTGEPLPAGGLITPEQDSQQTEPTTPEEPAEPAEPEEVPAE